MIKKIVTRIVFVLINFAIMYGLYIAGVRAIIGFITGVFVGACIIIYWNMSKNGYLSYIVKDIITNKEKVKKNGKKT